MEWTCPVPLRTYPTVVMGHGGGGEMTAELIEHLFRPALRSDHTATPDGDDAQLLLGGDSAVLPWAGPGQARADRTAARLALTTDSFVVRPLRFPGGSIGDLAVNGTVNDLAVAGAVPTYLAAAFILEEGLPMEVLGSVVADMGAAARAAGVRLVTGDTKVVESGHGDGLFVTTTGIGVVAADVAVGPDRARPGDVVILSGPVGRHGTAIMSVREGLEFGSEITSDTCALHRLTADMLAAGGAGVHMMRDATRGGLAAALVEVAESSRAGIVLDERAVPVPADVAAACRFLGLDPLQVANEGVLVAFVAAEAADAVLAAMRSRTEGAEAVVVGQVVADHPGVATARTGIGGSRTISRQVAEQLPRIC